MVESPLGRRGSLAATTFITAFFCIVFVLVRSAFLVRVSSVGISLSATVGGSPRHVSIPCSYGADADYVCCTVWVCPSSFLIRAHDTNAF